MSGAANNIGGFASGAAGAALGYIGGNQQQTNANTQAVNQRDWENYESSTAHQREVADLKAAGLNPMLSVNAGASTPSAAQAPVVNPIQNSVTSAKDAVDTISNFRAVSAGIDKTRAETLAALAQPGLIGAQTASAKAAAALAAKQQQKIDAEMPFIKLESGLADRSSTLINAVAPPSNSKEAKERSDSMGEQWGDFQQSLKRGAHIDPLP